ncbi:uncharacterized protein LOC141728294 [Zonotrichia albicollis]|uniref:uncharacterized protein LOC141728294 n=1 Tax=Zonotrichia albicollis TaxID=44394 RepID=UPI003D80E2A3
MDGSGQCGSPRPSPAGQPARPRSPGPPRAGRGPELQVGRRLCLPSGAKRRRHRGGHPPAADRAPRSRRRGRGSPRLTGIPETFLRAAAREEPPLPPPRAPGAEPGTARCPRLSPGPPGAAEAAPRSGLPPAIRRPLPSPRRRPLTHPRPANAATGASCPRSLPPVKLSPASLRPSSPRPAPPSRTGSRRHRLGPPPAEPGTAPPSPGPAAAAAAGERGKMGTAGAAPGSPSQRRDRAAPPGAPGAPPRRDAPRGEGGGGLGRAVPGCAVPGAGGHGRRGRLLPLREARSDLGVAAGKLGSFPGRGGRDHAALWEEVSGARRRGCGARLAAPGAAAGRAGSPSGTRSQRRSPQQVCWVG